MTTFSAFFNEMVKEDVKATDFLYDVKTFFLLLKSVESFSGQIHTTAFNKLIILHLTSKET